MFNHAPANYECPFCRLVLGGEDDWTKQSDIVHRDERVTAFVAPAWWPNNAGHAIVIPSSHVENIYDLTGEQAKWVHELAQRIAIAMMQTYGCDGTSTRQHNGPSGGQEVWHYHLHVFPRYEADGLYGSKRRRTEPHEREPYVRRLCRALSA